MSSTFHFVTGIPIKILTSVFFFCTKILFSKLSGYKHAHCKHLPFDLSSVLLLWRDFIHIFVFALWVFGIFAAGQSRSWSVLQLRHAALGLDTIPWRGLFDVLYVVHVASGDTDLLKRLWSITLHEVPVNVFYFNLFFAFVLFFVFSLCLIVSIEQIWNCRHV